MPEFEAMPVAPALIEEWALAYLGRYASSAENLRRVLLRRVRRRIPAGIRIDGEMTAAIGALVERYRGAGLLDDVAYATSRARQGQARGRSLRRIAAGLAAKGIGAADAAAGLAALRKSTGDPELAAACIFARRRRLGPYRRGSAAPAGDQRELAAFARAGFARSVAERVLGCPNEAAVAALLTDAELVPDGTAGVPPACGPDC